MDEDSDGAVDLFGDPWRPPRDPRGRKAHRWTREVAEKVAVLKVTGEGHAAIAARIGLSERTLKKYYFRELDNGGARARQVLVETMWAKALDGNVPAAKFIASQFPKGDANAFLDNLAAGGERRSSPAPRRGKKEEAQLAAETAGVDSEWGDDLVAKPH